VGPFSISIAAPPALYERAMHKPLEAIERPVIKELGRSSTTTFINAVDASSFGQLDVQSTPWQDVLDGVAFSEPIYYYGDAQPDHPTELGGCTCPAELPCVDHAASLFADLPCPQVAPPVTVNDANYLQVPQGLAEALNATAAHRAGITGQGVHVVMVDTGWYRHPFFDHHGYHVTVRLAPGSVHSDRDSSGHGTGESANVLAIAPGIQLTVLKADVAIQGKVRNVNSISALKAAIALHPDIITCSWGSDERSGTLSPFNRVLGAVVAEAVRQGIVMVFSAGNSHYGFPAQHPEVIAVGGAYLHLSGSRRGTLEASNYASSFVSPIYGDRRVPDLCGLVGKLPYGAYLMLPVSPGSEVDRGCATIQDGTEATDGWAAFSGTSAAAPQIAGICALLKQVRRSLSPAQMKAILTQTARDVAQGFSHVNTGRAEARAGPDLATGYGLADAYGAIAAARPQPPITPPPTYLFSNQPNLSPPLSSPTRNQPMSSQFPKLQKNLDEIEARLNEVLKSEFVDTDLIEDLELTVTEYSFSERSSQTDVIASLRELLLSIPTMETKGKKTNDRSKNELDTSQIQRKHILAAQSLLKVQKCQDLAIKVLLAGLKKDDSNDHETVSEMAAKALGELDLNHSFSSRNQNEMMGYIWENNACYYQYVDQEGKHKKELVVDRSHQQCTG
jgi:subtilisin family serine protease